MELGALFVNQLVKWDEKLKEDLDKMLEKANTANERWYFGKLCIEVAPVSKISYISEELCIACGICVKKCPFEAIQIMNLPKDLNKDTTHHYGPNTFKLYRLPVPRHGQVLDLVGTNGIGKSTTLKVLAGKLKLNLGRYKNPPDWQEILTYFRGSELQNYFTRILEDNLKVLMIQEARLEVNGQHMIDASTRDKKKIIYHFFQARGTHRVSYLVSQKYTGEKVVVKVLRNSKVLEFSIKLASQKRLIPSHIKGTTLSYNIITGLVFTAVSVPYLRSEYGKDYEYGAPVKLLDKYLHTMAQSKDEHIVVISQVLVADINIVYEEIVNTQVRLA